MPITVKVSEIGETVGRSDGRADEFVRIERYQFLWAAHRIAHGIDTAHPIRTNVILGQILDGRHQLYTATM